MAAVINSIISVYYYTYPLVVMFFRPAPEKFVRPRVSAPVAVALALIATFWLGILPNGVFGLLKPSAPQAVSQQIPVVKQIQRLAKEKAGVVTGITTPAF